MGRERVPSAPSGDRRRGHRKTVKSPPGLRVVERDGYWHLHGTIRVKDSSIRVREGTGLPARPENWDAADKLRREKETQVVDQVVYGIKPTVPVAVAIDLYLNPSPARERPLSDTDVRNLKEIAAEFGLRRAREIPEGDWVAFVGKRQAGNALTTRERYLNTLFAFLNWCREKPRQYIDDLPHFERSAEARSPTKRQRRRVAELTPDLVVLMFEHAHISNRAQYATEWSTGGRVSAVLHQVRLCDVILAEGREQITFAETKNGDAVIAALHPFTAAVLREYLESRGNLHDREGPLFLDRLGRPYTQRYGGNRTAFDGMKRRTVKTLRRAAAAGRVAGDHDRMRSLWERAKLVKLVTQHWFRHWFATHAIAGGMDAKAVMTQAGWRDHRSLFSYAHDVEPARRAAVRGLAIGHVQDQTLALPAPMPMKLGGPKRRGT